MQYKIMMSTSIVLAILLFNGCGGVNNGENKQEVAKQNVMDKGLTKESHQPPAKPEA